MLGDECAQKVCRRSCISSTQSKLVEGLRVGGGGCDAGIAGNPVQAGGELELVGSLEVGAMVLAVDTGVVPEVKKDPEHFC